MTKFVLGLVILLAGCSNLAPYGASSSPVDLALKTCGLGYAAEVGPVFKLAYEYASIKGGADFSGQMHESLDTQVAAIAKSDAFSKGMDSKDKLAFIQGTQSCVIKFADAMRPKTESELIGACMADLQERVAGKGNSWPVVKNWDVQPEHPKSTKYGPVVRAYVDHGGAHSYWILVQCNWRDGKYDNLDAVGG